MDNSKQPPQDTAHIDKEFRERLIQVIKDHARVSDKVIREVRVQWNTVGSSVNGYAFEYEQKN